LEKVLRERERERERGERRSPGHAAQDDVEVRLKRKHPLPGSITFDLPFRFNYFISTPLALRILSSFIIRWLIPVKPPSVFLPVSLSAMDGM